MSKTTNPLLANLPLSGGSTNATLLGGNIDILRNALKTIKVPCEKLHLILSEHSDKKDEHSDKKDIGKHIKEIELNLKYIESLKKSMGKNFPIALLEIDDSLLIPFEIISEINGSLLDQNDPDGKEKFSVEAETTFSQILQNIGVKKSIPINIANQLDQLRNVVKKFDKANITQKSKPYPNNRQAAEQESDSEFGSKLAAHLSLVSEPQNQHRVAKKFNNSQDFLNGDLGQALLATKDLCYREGNQHLGNTMKEYINNLETLCNNIPAKQESIRKSFGRMSTAGGKSASIDPIEDIRRESISEAAKNPTVGALLQALKDDSYRDKFIENDIADIEKTFFTLLMSDISDHDLSRGSQTWDYGKIPEVIESCYSKFADKLILIEKNNKNLSNYEKDSLAAFMDISIGKKNEVSGKREITTTPEDALLKYFKPSFNEGARILNVRQNLLDPFIADHSSVDDLVKHLNDHKTVADKMVSELVSLKAANTKNAQSTTPKQTTAPKKISLLSNLFPTVERQ